MEYCLSPATNALQDRLRENEIRLAMLTEEAKALEIEAFRGNESSGESPRKFPTHGVRGSAPMGQRDLYASGDSTSSRSLTGTGSRSRKGS
ncbi:hypothetical protein HHK36_013983 [Tetracentron sinense]|uniref:BRCC36 C-terminal helical domain-containing protein n=1 Tax=Tetracentron sinense TaxID=13715 RepID=A0A835DDU7_TETSI|nr:hypothetical protein HHK36_013983 [Tetracentron sinense]